ncbi:unnamed protein product [Schistosoma turkestanicum]|nr:unnamed protein product [Schistosoma turkestanicum]
MLKGYFKSVVDLVNNLTEPASGDSAEVLGGGNKDQSNASSEEPQTTGCVISSQNSENSESSSLLSRLPNLLAASGENSMLYYVNSFASMGINSSEEHEKQVSQESEKSLVITKDISKIQVSENTDVSVSQEDNTLITDDMNSDRTDGFSAKTSRVWELIKKDFNEVVHSVSEPKDAVYRTASSVRDRITAAANTVKNLNPNEFLLPDNETKTDQQLTNTANVVDDDLTALPPELPSFSNIKQDVSQLVDSFYNGLMSTGTFFGLITPRENQSKDKSKHQTRLDVLRADPATYELEPPTPPTSSGIHSYRDWRLAYFDEDNCQPMNGIPLADAKNPEYNNVPIEELTQPPHPSPAELLDSYPFMRTYLTQLVHPDGKINDKSISDADFWSRYYYRVWLLDSTEFRRRKLNERVESVSTVKQTISNQSTRYTNNADETSEDLNLTEDDKWPDSPDSDDHTTVENNSEISNKRKFTKHCHKDTAVTTSNSNSNFDGDSNNLNEKSNNDCKSKRKHVSKKSTNKNKPLKEINCDNKEIISDKLDHTKVECLSDSTTENQNSTNILSDFEEMISDPSSVVILTDEVGQDEVENDVMTVEMAITTDKPIVHSSEIPTVEHKTSISDDEVWSDSDESEDCSIDKTNKKSTKNNNNNNNATDETDTTRNSESQLTDEADDWENWS